jgi:hypothetical protein
MQKETRIITVIGQRYRLIDVMKEISEVARKNPDLRFEIE